MLYIWRFTMKNKLVKRIFISMIGLFILGFILIFSSGSIGENAGDATVMRNGGSIATIELERVINSTVLNYQISGAILSLFGGAGILVVGNHIFLSKHCQ